MSVFITQARPYARAAFEFAVEHHVIAHWQNMLLFAASVTRNKAFSRLLISTTRKNLSSIFIALCGAQLDTPAQNFIRIMAENGRLLLLSEVLRQFIQRRAELEAIREVDVYSVIELTAQQQEKIAAAIRKRLSHKVKLNCKIDKSILSGLIVRAGDLVIDGSVRSRLERLARVLQS